MACLDPPSGSALTGTATALAVPKAQGAVMNYVPWRLLHEVRMAGSTVQQLHLARAVLGSGEFFSPYFSGFGCSEQHLWGWMDVVRSQLHTVVRP